MRLTLEHMKSSKSLTITELARHLGLATTTVSYALNGRGPEMKIAKQTVARIHKAAKELGYQPNFFAHNLRRKHTETIGIIFADLEENWAHRILRGIVSVFDKASYTPLLAVHFWETEREKREIQSLFQRKVDALICFPLPQSIEVYKQLIRQKKKFIFLGDTLPDLPQANYLAWDFGQAATTVMQHLIGRGYRRIGFVGPDHPTRMTLARFQAYRNNLEQAGLPLNPKWIIWEKSGQVPREAVLNMVKVKKASERPDALFIMNDGLALPLLEVLETNGIRVPQQVAIASIGDLLASGHESIGLTSVHEPCKELGKGLAEATLELIRDDGEIKIQRNISSNILKLRRTAP